MALSNDITVRASAKPARDALERRLEIWRREIDTALARDGLGCDGQPAPLIEATRFSLVGPAKRIRALQKRLEKIEDALDALGWDSMMIGSVGVAEAEIMDVLSSSGFASDLTSSSMVTDYDSAVGIGTVGVGGMGRDSGALRPAGGGSGRIGTIRGGD